MHSTSMSCFQRVGTVYLSSIVDTLHHSSMSVVCVWCTVKGDAAASSIMSSASVTSSSSSVTSSSQTAPAAAASHVTYHITFNAPAHNLQFGDSNRMNCSTDSTQVCCGLVTLFFVWTPPRDLVLLRLNTGVLWSHYLVLCLNTTSRPCSSQTQHTCVVVSLLCSLSEHHLETLFFSDSTQVCCVFITLFFVWTPPRDLVLVRLNTGVW